jgi:hypothetical protein
MKVQEVKYIADYTISIKFDDGISGTIQLKDLVQKGIFIAKARANALFIH